MKKENLQNFDLAKMVCALLVICIHASPADGASAWVRFYVTMKNHCDILGVRAYNATRGGKQNGFPHRDFNVLFA